MFDDIDEALRKLLIREIPIRNNEIEIAFEQPKREWSARLNRPTLNLFLHDVRENAKLRQSYVQRQRMDPAKRSLELRMPEARVDLHYMISAWAAEPEDEHRLLARTLLVFLGHRELPGDVLPAALQDQPRPIALSAAQYDAALNPTDMWGVLDNELRPSISCMVTLTLDPHAPITVPAVRERELRMGGLHVRSLREQPLPQRNGAIYQPLTQRQRELERIQPPGRDGAEPSQSERRWTVGGTVDGPLDGARLILVDRDQEIPIAADGTFVIGNLQAGTYTLALHRGDGEPVQRSSITVPTKPNEFGG